MLGFALLLATILSKQANCLEILKFATDDETSTCDQSVRTEGRERAVAAK